MPADFKDYYKILGVAKDATADDIKKAYRKLAKEQHPDLNPGGDQTKFAEINEAYEVLKDADERKKYDEIAAYLASGGSRTQPPRQEYDFDEDGSSFFEQFFGRRQSQASPRKGADLQAEVEISLREALDGTVRRLSLDRQEPCPECQGTGLSGRTVCPACRGRGAVLVESTVEVKIPAGVTTGSVVRLAGQGQPGATRGELLLHIVLGPDPVYRVEGRNLHRDLPVDLYTAILGGSVEFEGPRGKKLGLKIAPETQNEKVFRLKGQGIPQTGDLYVKLSVRIPTGLTESQRETFRSLQQEAAPHV